MKFLDYVYRPAGCPVIVMKGVLISRGLVGRWLLLWSNEITDCNREDAAFLINWLAQYLRQNYCNIELHAILGVQGWNKYFLVLDISLTRHFPQRKNKERTDRVIKKTWCYFVDFINHHSLAVISYYFQPSSPFDHF